jgi:membrane associated rhomboid family serine protease
MTLQRLPWATIVIIALNFVVFAFTWIPAQRDQEKLWGVIDDIEVFAESNPGIANEDFESQQALEQYKRLLGRLEEARRESLFGQYGFVPIHQEWSDLFCSMFLHAGWLHLLGNMYLLWMCGCSLEDVWGRPLYLLVFLASGTAAALSHAYMFPDSGSPLVGASGAIAGLMGAFLIRYYNARIRFFYWIFFVYLGTFFAPAWIMLPLWLASQFFYAFVYGDSSPVAFWAHIGGFIFGLVVALYLKLSLVEEAFLAPAIEEKTTLFSQHPAVEAALGCCDRGEHQEGIRHLYVALRNNPEDIDALHLLAQCNVAIGRYDDATKSLQQKMRIHLKRGEKELAIDTYFEMQAIQPSPSLSAREALLLASALAQSNYHQEAIQLLRGLFDSNISAPMKLKASLALADLYAGDNKTHLALQLLESVIPICDSYPEWKMHIRKKTEKIRKASA